MRPRDSCAEGPQTHLEWETKICVLNVGKIKLFFFFTCIDAGAMVTKETAKNTCEMLRCIPFQAGGRQCP